MNRNKVKILVTGGAGNVGSALVKFLIKNNNYFVVIIDDLSTGDINKIPKADNNNLIFINADTNNYQDLSQIMLSYNFDYVFHYAAVVGVQRTLDNPIKVLKDIDGIKNILYLSKNTSVKRVFYSSSSEVYGEPVELPQNEETTPLNSRLPYAIVKNVGESYFKSFGEFYNLNYTIFRFFNTYGPNQSEDFVIPKLLKRALDNEDITIYGDGNQTRTFCYIDDNINSCIKIFEKSLFINDVVNIGSDKTYTINELVKTIVNLTKSKSKIINIAPLKDGDMTRRQPDNTKMLKVLGKKLINLNDGLNMMIKFYKNN